MSGRVIRYVDWVLPGVLAMNMMFSCLFGVGYVIVRYRKNGMLKRLKATPLRPLEFLSAQIFHDCCWSWSRPCWCSSVPICSSVSPCSVPISPCSWCLRSARSACSASACWLPPAPPARNWRRGPERPELAHDLSVGGLVSLEGVHPSLQQCAQLAPLTHIIDASRAIMIDGASLADVSGHLLVLTAMSLGCMLIGAWMFRWE